MTFAEIRAHVLENVGRKIHPGHDHLKRIINRSVEHVTNLVELVYKPYNVAQTAQTVSVVAGTLEYKVGDVTATPIRKIFLVERTDGTTDPIQCQIIDFRRKNDFGSRASMVNIGARTLAPIIYFRRVPGGDWYMGFPTDPGTNMTIDVYYIPNIVSLTADSDVPREVPEHHHELISVRSTILLLSQHGIDTRLWERQYVELRNVMEADLENWNRTGPRFRRMRSQNAFRAHI